MATRVALLRGYRVEIETFEETVNERIAEIEAAGGDVESIRFSDGSSETSTIYLCCIVFYPA